MQLSGAIARNSGESCDSEKNTNNLAASLSSRYSPLFFVFDVFPN
jgi:hypothetical protein